MISILVTFLIVFLLIALNGFFVAAEFSLIGTPPTLVEKKAMEGDWTARKVMELLTEPSKQDRFIATAQLGITVASLGLGMYGEHTIAEWFGQILLNQEWGENRWIAAHTMASIMAVTLLTYFHIVLGEMVPKSIALQSPERVVMWIAPIMKVVEWCVYPLVWVLNGVGNGLLRIFGIDRREETDRSRTPEELSYIVDESEVGGELGKESADVLRELLEFGELTAGEVMIPRTQIVGIASDMKSSEIQELLRRKPHTRYIVYQDDLDKILGFIHVKDILRLIRSSDGIPPEAIPTVPFVPASSSLESVLRAMRKAGSQLTVVMDEHGGTAGLITIEDLFEEVVGDISEDFSERPEIHRSSEGTYRVQGTVRLADLGEELEKNLEHDTVDTVSGLILAFLERPAQVGDEVSYNGINLRVTLVRGRGVAECTVSIHEDHS